MVFEITSSPLIHIFFDMLGKWSRFQLKHQKKIKAN